LYSVVVKSSINSSVKNFLIFIILGFFSLFIGLRYQVGTDYENYLRAVLEFDPSFINYIQSGELEISVFFIRYVAVIINFPAFFFIMSAFLTLVFVHFAIKKFFVNDNIAFFIYLLTFFPDSLNLVRQMLALSIILLAIGLIKQNKRIAALFAIIFAATFHTTAILAIAFIFLDYRIYEGILKNKSIKIVFLIFVFIGIPALVINLQNIIIFFNNRGLLTNFSRYAQVIQTAENREIYLKSLITLTVFLFSFKLIEYDNYNFNLIILLMIGFLLTFTGINNPFIKRLSYYFDIVTIILIANIYKIQKLRFNRYITGSIIFLYAFSRFILVYYYIGHNEIFPYQLIF
jgi:hypothetical protein